MEFAVKRFARNILLLHLLLLLVVLALMLLASKAIREGAREQAQQQAETRQRMLAGQTARGIEAFYHSIISDMDLMPRADDDQLERDKLGKMLGEMMREIPVPLFGRSSTSTQSSRHQSPRPETRPSGDGRPPRDAMAKTGPPSKSGKPLVGRGMLLGHLLGRQLEERVTHMFVVNRPFPKTGPIQIKDVVIKPADGAGPTPEAVALRFRDWLGNVQAQSISRFELFDGKGYNLVALPINRGQGVMVAAVPVSTITEQYLDALHADPNTGVLLVNDSLQVMAASRPNLVGIDIDVSGDADLVTSLEASKASGFSGSHLIEHSFQIGGETFEPALLTAEPINVAGRKWFIAVGSPLREVDAVVATLFGKIFVWAIIVVAAITAILISTSVQMIRGRVRLERVRTESLRQELDRARQIQQAWLPRESPSCPTIDVAAVNFPANHISGDFYNWFELADGRIAVVIGDVTGHGMSAAFLMATTQLLVRTTMQRLSDPAACLEEVNRQLCTLIFNGQFVTLQIAVLDPCSGTVELSSAGHPAPLLAGPDGFEMLPVDSHLVLGVDPEAIYETSTLELPADAALLMFTDGAPDIQAPNGKRLGNDGLRKVCPAKWSRASAATHDAKWMLDAIVQELNQFRGSRELGDDLTLVSVRLSATASASNPVMAAMV